MPRPDITVNRNGTRTVERTINHTTQKKPWFILLPCELKKGDKIILTMDADGLGGKFRLK